CDTFVSRDRRKAGTGSVGRSDAAAATAHGWVASDMIVATMTNGAVVYGRRKRASRVFVNSASTAHVTGPVAMPATRASGSVHHSAPTAANTAAPTRAPQKDCIPDATSDAVYRHRRPPIIPPTTPT